MEYISHSEAETEAIGERLAAALSPGAVVAYRGGLGMGKTAFTRGLARGGVCAVEWSEQVADALPEDAVTVTLARHPDHDDWRIITVEGGAAL